ncbi:MAG TPA: ABC transporter permease subunit [Solirubrobacteraceae bacterium]|jgi:ABC-type transport system involved in multi-copper enzyme maturation permease subunit|nr:ABC transporter permease subunit [Solirubrobacteraceae bacterium]
MTATATAAPHPPIKPAGGRFRSVIWSEWSKFRTVRGWVIGLVAAAGLCVAFTFLVANGKHEGGCTGPPSPGSGPNSPGSGCYTGHPFVPTGPDGEAVADSYQLVDRPLSGDGTITARVSSLTGLTSTNPVDVAPSIAATRPGLAPWAKAGILITPSTTQGSPYAAVIATGSHGIRFQYDYTHDRAGLPGAVSGAAPSWVRLTRSGDALTGYDSADGTTWHEIGVAHLAGLPATVIVGLLVTSPVSFQGSSGGAATQATATFDHVTLNGHAISDDLQGRSIGTGANDFYPTLGTGGYRRSGPSLVLSGSGDIAPAVGLAGGDTASNSLLFGLIVGLIVVIVIATMFITVEYRRGLIRTTFTATPNRGRVLAAKAVVIGAAAFAIGALAAALAVPLGEHILNDNGDYVFPSSTLTVARIILGSGALVAVTAVAAVAVGTILRRSADAVTGAIVVFILPYIIGSSISGGAAEWLFRVTPAAGFAVLGAMPHSAQVSYPYTMANGYYPLAPGAGLLVLCAYAAVAVAIATSLLRRRDA